MAVACPISAFQSRRATRLRPGRHHRARRPTRPRCLSPASRSQLPHGRKAAPTSSISGSIRPNSAGRVSRRQYALTADRADTLATAAKPAAADSTGARTGRLEDRRRRPPVLAARPIVRRTEQRFRLRSQSNTRAACHPRRRPYAHRRHADLHACGARQRRRYQRLTGNRLTKD